MRLLLRSLLSSSYINILHNLDRAFPFEAILLHPRESVGDYDNMKTLLYTVTKNPSAETFRSTRQSETSSEPRDDQLSVAGSHFEAPSLSGRGWWVYGFCTSARSIPGESIKVAKTRVRLYTFMILLQDLNLGVVQWSLLVGSCRTCERERGSRLLAPLTFSQQGSTSTVIM